MTKIPLRNRAGEVVAHALVDDEDYKRPEIGTKRWYLDSHGYAARSSPWVNGRRHTIRLHRVVTEALEEIVDHKNHDKLDNRSRNLRLLPSNGENQQNEKLSKNNTSGHKGVTWHKPAQKWRACIGVDGGDKHLGLFEKIEDAVAARLKAEAELHPYAVRGEETP